VNDLKSITFRNVGTFLVFSADQFAVQLDGDGSLDTEMKEQRRKSIDGGDLLGLAVDR
tara:strand:- start:8 stop:181 length:174 start_codon:yes stop_codon:yes gene_type:complete